MALQELELHIRNRLGKAYNNADALSHCTTTQINDSDVPWKVLAAVQADVQLVKEGEGETRSSKQLADPEIAEVSGISIGRVQGAGAPSRAGQYPYFSSRYVTLCFTTILLNILIF